MSLPIFKKLINRALAPFGYVVVSRKTHSELTRKLKTKDAELAQLREDVAGKDRKLGRLAKNLERSEKEREVMTMKLQQAVRADLERQFLELNDRR